MCQSRCAQAARVAGSASRRCYEVDDLDGLLAFSCDRAAQLCDLGGAVEPIQALASATLVVRRARLPCPAHRGHGGDGPRAVLELLVKGPHVAFDGHHVVGARPSMTCAVSCWVCIASTVTTAEARLATLSAGPAPRGSRSTSRPRRPARGQRRCRAPGPRPGAGPCHPCPSRRGRSCRRRRLPAGRRPARPWSRAMHREPGRAHQR